MVQLCERRVDEAVAPGRREMVPKVGPNPSDLSPFLGAHGPWLFSVVPPQEEEVPGRHLRLLCDAGGHRRAHDFRVCSLGWTQELI